MSGVLAVNNIDAIAVRKNVITSCAGDETVFLVSFEEQWSEC